jgi:hypothetical protein
LEEAEKFGFKVNDQVLWTNADASVPKGTKGTIVSFTASCMQPIEDSTKQPHQRG